MIRIVAKTHKNPKITLENPISDLVCPWLGTWDAIHLELYEEAPYRANHLFSTYCQ